MNVELVWGNPGSDPVIDVRLDGAVPRAVVDVRLSAAQVRQASLELGPRGVELLLAWTDIVGAAGSRSAGIVA